jgi:aspartate racemase
VLSILDVAAEAVRGRVPPVRTAGLLATTGTVRSGVFQTALAAAGVGVRVPTPAEQERVMAAIYSIKGALGNMERKALRDALGVIARRLVADGAEAIVLGCTELPLILADADLGVPVFDVVLLLARAAIVAAGREPAA